MARKAAEARQANPDNSSDAPSAPGNEDDDRVLDQQALQAGEEEEQQRGLDEHHPLIGGHT